MKKLTIFDALPVIAGLVLTVAVLALFSRTLVSALDFLGGSFTSRYYFCLLYTSDAADEL